MNKLTIIYQSSIIIISYLLLSFVDLLRIYKKSDRFLLDNYDFTLYDVVTVISQTYKKVLINLFVHSYIIILILNYHITERDINYYYDTICLIINIPLTHLIYFILHKLFHTEYFYEYHRLNHELENPIGFCLLYCSTFEVYLLNYLPIILGLMIFKAHINICIIWILYGMYYKIFKMVSPISNLNFYKKHMRDLNTNIRLFI